MRISILVALLIGSVALAAADQQVIATVDWESGTLTVTVQRPLPASGPNLPAAVAEIRSAIERDSVSIVMDQLRLLSYDSLRTVNELLIEEPHLVSAIVSAAGAAEMVDARATPDLRQVEVVFELGLHDALLSRVISHDRPIPLVGRLGWTPTAEYTGIVIYAAEELSVHGTTTIATLEPTLMPGIYYQNAAGDGVTRLMEAGHVSPAAVTKWGPVLYSDDVIGSELNDRIGEQPLRMIAYGAFGRYPTDVVISYEDALQILANENNRSLIAEGRVAIVVTPDQM